MISRKIRPPPPFFLRKFRIFIFQMKTALLIFCLYLLSAALASPTDLITLSTPYGSLTGSEEQGIYAFRGVPFAAPPVGNLRFRPAQPLTPWSGVLNATIFAPGCIQQCSNPKPLFTCPLTVSEDCLYLNIYAPISKSGGVGNSTLLPVIFYMHGGNYVDGSGGTPIYDGGDVARRNNVVVVATNYRMGVFGALYTGTLKGNFHLSDQIEALSFLNKAISSFGGNPDSVTITGQSAGAFSVATLLSTPRAWPFFHKAIVVSNPFGILAAPVTHAISLGSAVLDQLNCSVGGGELERECLRNSSVDALMSATGVNYPVSGSNYLLMMMQWTPVVDGDLPYQPIYALSHGHFNKVPIMMGTCANESVP